MVGYDRFMRATATLEAHAHAGVYEVCYIVAGSVEWWAGDDVTEVGPGEAYVTRPGERHGGTDAFMHPCELYWAQIAFPLRGIEPRDAKAIEGAFGRISLRHFRASEQFASCCRRMLDEHLSPRDHSPVVVRAALHELLVQVVRDHDQAVARVPTNAPSEPVRKALRWMEQNLADDFSVEELARVVGLRPSRFHERFVAETGFTPAEQRTRLRVRRAKQLLRVPSATVTDIAFDLGFSTSQYFATVFKNQVGLTPKQYRDRARGDGTNAVE
jgi:AraC family L-rhamnose operon regulatory protein RhaS